MLSLPSCKVGSLSQGATGPLLLALPSNPQDAQVAEPTGHDIGPPHTDTPAGEAHCVQPASAMASPGSALASLPTREGPEATPPHDEASQAAMATPIEQRSEKSTGRVGRECRTKPDGKSRSPARLVREEVPDLVRRAVHDILVGMVHVPRVESVELAGGLSKR